MYTLKLLLRMFGFLDSFVMAYEIKRKKKKIKK